MADINVKLVKSLIGSTKPQIATAYALGLHKIGDESVQPDNAATGGKIRNLATLVEPCVHEHGAEDR